jgi:hypothetical protein
MKQFKLEETKTRKIKDIVIFAWFYSRDDCNFEKPKRIYKADAIIHTHCTFFCSKKIYNEIETSVFAMESGRVIIYMSRVAVFIACGACS